MGSLQSEDFLTQPPEGTRFRTLHVQRTLRVYPIEEGELRILSSMNSLALIFFSVGSGLLTFAVGLIADGILEGELTQSARTLLQVVAPMCGVLAFGSYAVGVWALRNRRSELNRIEEQTVSR